jgi:hypothetical protein
MNGRLENEACFNTNGARITASRGRALSALWRLTLRVHAQYTHSFAQRQENEDLMCMESGSATANDSRSCSISNQSGYLSVVAPYAWQLFTPGTLVACFQAGSGQSNQAQGHSPGSSSGRRLGEPASAHRRRADTRTGSRREQRAENPGKR